MATEFQPYVGPRPFERTEADQNRFFGRDYEASELLSRITAHSAFLLYSQSGAGKTSLINAKLIPLLEEEGFEVLEPARVRTVLADDNVLDYDSNIYAYNVLRNWDEGRTSPKLLAHVSIPEFLKRTRSKVSAEEDETPRVVIFDQFEELFSSYQERSKDREKFFEQIGDALEEDRVLRVVFVMREDFIGELDPYVSFLPEKLRTRFRLERLSEEDALLAITEPLKGTEYSYAEHVAEQLVHDLLMVPIETAKGVTIVKGESVEPVQLQVVCQTLWANCQNSWRGLQASDKKIITLEQLETFGDVDQALSVFYENAIAGVVQASGVKEGVLRRWFEQSLITSVGTRGTVFRGHTETGGIPNAAVNELVNHHIIRGELRGGSRWYELTHDRLIGPIQKSNEKWVGELAEETRKDLEAKAEEWERLGRDNTGLLNEEELVVANRWMSSKDSVDLGYSQSLSDLVEASRAAVEEATLQRKALAEEQQRRAEAERQRAEERELRLREHARAHRRLRLALVGLTVMFLIAVGSTIFATVKWREAAKSAADAEAATIVANSSAANAVNAFRYADTQRQIAEEQARLAQIAKTNAEQQRQIAEAQTRLANKARELAQVLQIETEKARKIAEVQLEVNQLNRELDVLISNVPADQREFLKKIENIASDLRSLYRQLNDSDGEKNALNKLAQSYANANMPDLVVNSYHEIVRIEEKANNFKGQAQWLRQIGLYYEKQTHGSTQAKERALESYLLASNALEKELSRAPSAETRKERAVILLDIGKLKEALGQKPAAIPFYLEAGDTFHKANFGEGEADALISLADVNASLGRSQEALAGYERALRIYDEPGKKGEVLVKLADLKLQQDVGVSANYYSEALMIATNRNVRAMALKGLGRVCENRELYSAGLDYYKRAKQIFEVTGYIDGQVDALLSISRIYGKLGKQQEADDFLERARSLKPEIVPDK